MSGANSTLKALGLENYSIIGDLDMAKAISDMKKQQTMQQYSMNMQKKQMEYEANLVKGFLFRKNI